MARFKSTHNIFTDFAEIFDENWMDSDKLVLPPKKNWDYSRPLQIEDVSIWEVILEQGGGWGLYASWDPYAEFYLLRMGFQGMETYYGAGVQKNLKKKLKELGISFSTFDVWVEPEDMWLYEKPVSKTLILP